MKIIENEPEKNMNINVGDVIKSESFLGTFYYLVVLLEGKYAIVDFSDGEVFLRTSETASALFEEHFDTEDEDLTILTVDKVVLTPK